MCSVTASDTQGHVQNRLIQNVVIKSIFRIKFVEAEKLGLHQDVVQLLELAKVW